METFSVNDLKGLDPEMQARLLLGLQVLFFMIVFRVLWLQFKTRRLRFDSHKSHIHHLRFLNVSICLLFLGALGYQATWHLVGLLRPEFVTFMQRYDRRLFNPARQLDRGKILDRNGIVLAENRKANGKVKRHYPFGPRLAHGVGYFHPVYGLNGIEKALDGHLGGTRAESIEDWERLGKNILTQEKALSGKDLRLTIHAKLQSAAYDLLGKRRGAVLVMGVRSGALYVICSRPAFDPNHLTKQTFRESDRDAPLLNRAIHGIYPTGSTFKIAIAACALDHNFPDKIECRSEFKTSNSLKAIRDHQYYEMRKRKNDWKGHGKIGLEDAMIQSCNVYFAKMGVMIGHRGYGWIAENMRFNRAIPIVNHRDGNIESSASRLPLLKKNDRYGLAQMGIGQGQLAMTPLQVALITAAVAGKGVAPVPRILASQKPRALGRFMSRATAERLEDILRLVVVKGTAQKAKALPWGLAGKTGTAENAQGAAHSWFVGFYPFELPQLVICVVIENGGYGSATALPVSMGVINESAKLGLFKMPN